jgi:glycosyltransferase involved in cell wall biosynthesis
MTGTHNGRVAVIIPVYRATFLADALASVFAQTQRPDEVVVIDDGSPDQAQLDAAVNPWGRRVTLLRQPNLGAGAARNHGLRATMAEFVALLDADDRWLPGFLHQQLAVMRTSPDLDVVYGNGRFISGELAGRTFMSTCPSVPQVTFARLLAQECTVLLSAVVARKSAIDAVGGFDESLRRGQDFDLWLRMARQGARIYSRTPVLVERRLHDNNLSGDSIAEMERPLRVFAKTLATMALSAEEKAIAEHRVRVLRAALAREQGKELLKVGDFPAARRAFDEARRGLQAWKLHAMALGLRVAPHLMRRLYLSKLPSAAS